MDRKTLEVLKKAESVLKEYIDTIERNGASLYYGRSVLQDIQAEIVKGSKE